MAYTKIKVSEDGPVTVIAFADPATMNAAGVDMAEELTAALRTRPSRRRRAGDRADRRGARLLLRREPEPGGAGRERGDAGSSLETVYNPLVTFVRDLSVPLVTAVNGAAAGVGCSLALLGDLIVAGESAYFLQAFRRIGLIPDGGSTYLLPRMIGRARAMEMALLGERVPAAKALEWGMINRFVPDAELMSTAMALASELANGPASLGLIRQTIWASLDTDWADQLTASARPEHRRPHRGLPRRRRGLPAKAPGRVQGAVSPLHPPRCHPGEPAARRDSSGTSAGRSARTGPGSAPLRGLSGMTTLVGWELRGVVDPLPANERRTHEFGACGGRAPRPAPPSAGTGPPARRPRRAAAARPDHRPSPGTSPARSSRPPARLAQHRAGARAPAHRRGHPGPRVGRGVGRVGTARHRHARRRRLAQR